MEKEFHSFTIGHIFDHSDTFNFMPVCGDSSGSTVSRTMVSSVIILLLVASQRCLFHGGWCFLIYGGTFLDFPLAVVPSVSLAVSSLPPGLPSFSHIRAFSLMLISLLVIASFQNQYPSRSWLSTLSPGTSYSSLNSTRYAMSSAT